MMKKIKLKCQTGGFNYGDVVSLTKKDCPITDEIAKSLIAEGLAEEVGASDVVIDAVEVEEVTPKKRGKK